MGVKKLSFEYTGSDYDPEFDEIRLFGQTLRVYNCMKEGHWRTLDEISKLAKAPQASVSAQLRHLRKPAFGSHTIEKQPRGERENGLWEYQLLVNPKFRQYFAEATTEMQKREAEGKKGKSKMEKYSEDKIAEPKAKVEVASASSLAEPKKSILERLKTEFKRWWKK